jgi:hypothetical protein
MPIIILLGLLAVLLAIWFAVKMKKSQKFDNIVKDITEPVDVTPKTSGEVIKDISEAEKALQAEKKAKDAEAEKALKESARIGDYLADKGVVKPKPKGKEKPKEKK